MLWFSCNLWPERLLPAENCPHHPASERQQVKTLSALALHERKKEGWRWIVRRGNLESEATGLLTGQLEGFQLLSGLNFPDRVGMQQAEGTSRGWKMMEDGPLKFAFKFLWLFCCFWCYNSKFAAEIDWYEWTTVKQLIRLIQTHTAWPVMTFLNFSFMSPPLIAPKHVIFALQWREGKQ